MINKYKQGLLVGRLVKLNVVADDLNVVAAEMMKDGFISQELHAPYEAIIDLIIRLRKKYKLDKDLVVKIGKYGGRKGEDGVCL